MCTPPSPCPSLPGKSFMMFTDNNFLITSGDLTVSSDSLNPKSEEDIGQSTFEEFLDDHQRWVQENMMEKDK